MFAQIFLGIYMITKGIRLLLKKDGLGEREKNAVSVNKRYSYQKGMVLPYFLLGILFITMGIVERLNVFPDSIFIGLFILLSIIPLGMFLINNKKHSGNYWLK